MAKARVFNLGSLNLKVSPFLQQNGDMIRMLNFEKDTIGGIKKRPGYTTYLGTPDNAQVNSLFQFRLNNGTQFWNYRASGSVLYYSTQGTGDWTVCGNGTITAGTSVVHAVDYNTLLISQDAGTTRHSTDGTSFTDTTSAPVAVGMVPYQERIYAAGTASDLFWSNVGTPTDWTNDSSSISISGPGRLSTVMKVNDRLIATKNSGVMYKYDGYSVFDLATNLGPSSPQSIGTVEGFSFWLNRLGEYGYGGAKPEIISNPIERLIYNDDGNGIIGTTFDNAPGAVHRYNYYLSIGTVTDDLTNEKIPDAILKYNFQLDEHSTYQFANRPTAWLSYRDLNGDQKFIFGDANGQCYTLGGTELSDNGSTIESVAEFVFHFGAPETDKIVNYIWCFANPGSQAKIQVAFGDTFTKQNKNWIDLKQLKDGVMEAKLDGARGKLIFVKVYEASVDDRSYIYGFAFDIEGVDRR